MANLILILGDQLSHEISAESRYKAEDIVIMAELRFETGYQASQEENCLYFLGDAAFC